MDMEMEDEILKVYGAPFWHSSVNIVGSKDSLIDLRDAIDKAIKEGASSADFFETDGEGYRVTVNCEERNFEEWARLPMHYTDIVATGNDTKEGEGELHKIISKTNE